MVADLYICKESLAYNGKDSLPDIVRKLSIFQILLEKVRQYSDENILFLLKEKFFETILCADGSTIGSIFSDYAGSLEKFGKDAYKLLVSLLNYCNTSVATLEDIKGDLLSDNAESCSAILVINGIAGLENNHQVLSNVGDWLRFRRFFLGKYPGDVDFFLAESKKYFPELCICPGTKPGLSKVLPSHHKQIVGYLSVLNDYLISDFEDYGNTCMPEFLKWFALKHSLDDSSFEGKKDDKFSFSFGTGAVAYCESHLKMFKDDKGNRNQHCRIYFKPPLKGDKIVYVGSICQHL